MRVFKPLLSGLSTVFSRLVLGLVQALGRLPLPVVRGVGVLMGWVLFVLAFPRRRVVLVNLRLCFPQWSRARRWAGALQTFVYFSQSWLDRGWLWEAPAEVLEQRLRRVGNWQALDQPGPGLFSRPIFTAWTLRRWRSACAPRASAQRFTPPSVTCWSTPGRGADVSALAMCI